MLTKQELLLIKKFLARVQPTQNKTMIDLAPELNGWQRCIAAIDRELKANQEEPSTPDRPQE